MLIRKDGTTVSVIDYCYVTPEAVSFELKGRRFATAGLVRLEPSKIEWYC